MKRFLVALGAAGILAGCASASGPPTIQTGPDAEVTADGLYRVDNSLVAMAWMKPDMDLRGYTAIMIDPVEVAYQRDPQGRTRSVGPGDPGGNFALTPAQMENFKSYFGEAVIEALSGDGAYRIVDTPGPDVLRITAELIDLIVRIPTQTTSARGGMAVRSYGEVTIVLEVRDSQSGEILARAADRQDPTGNSARDFVAVQPSFVRNDTRRLFAYWAGLLRERFDQLREVEIEPNQ